MKIPIGPAGLMLVGFLFICIILIPAAASQQPSSREQLNKLMDQHQKSPLGMLKVGAETINFPWFSQENRNVYTDLPVCASTTPKNEAIMMDNSNPAANVQDLSAMNHRIQRDLIFKDSQEADPENDGPVNRQEISVSGAEDDEYADEAANIQWQEDNIGGQDPNNKNRYDAGNYLNIDVHNIYVSAINTVQGGSAAATSNIIIEPVQIIFCTPEVGVKLK